MESGAVVVATPGTEKFCGQAIMCGLFGAEVAQNDDLPEVDEIPVPDVETVNAKKSKMTLTRVSFDSLVHELTEGYPASEKSKSTDSCTTASGKSVKPAEVSKCCVIA
jgi:hypothetical protein